jgi:hypothetical protein
MTLNFRSAVLRRVARRLRLDSGGPTSKRNKNFANETKMLRLPPRKFLKSLSGEIGDSRF